ncbi:MAG TPA: methyltransferase [Candidatus Saccharimonadales bacterium]|nr:methyltransferase [Candidatus Saccharimonadales bacterium]
MSQHTVRKKPRKPHQFRFQLLTEWLTATYQPCKIADIGGGKGLLAYLLSQNGFNTVVIDPVSQNLPHKFKDLKENKRVKLADLEAVKRISEPFQTEMAQDFDLLIGLHTHGSNMKIIDAAKKYDKDFVLLPCCVIDEPIVKRHNVDWLESLVEYAQLQGLYIKKVQLNFMGQNIALYTDKYQAKR